jgi:hypothetical protein
MYQNNTNSTQTKTTSSYTADTIDIKVINVIGDGNFFSWCISVYFNDTQTHHETIRTVMFKIIEIVFESF